MKKHICALLLLFAGSTGMLSIPIGAASATPVVDWLVIGSFHTSDDNEILDFPYLPEQELAPSPGEKAGGFTWQAVSATTARVDLRDFDFPVKRFCAAYAFTYIHAEKDGNAQLVLDSGDGLAVWVNGEEVWRDFIYVNPWHDSPRDHVVDVVLQKGLNRLLLKICELNSGWRFGRNWSFSCSIDAESGIAFSLTNPDTSERAGRGGYDSLALTNIGLRAMENGTGITAEVAISNFSNAKAENIRCLFVTPSGEELGEVVLRSVDPRGYARGDIPLDAVMLARALSDDGSRIVLQTSEASDSYPVPGNMAVSCLCLVAATAETSDNEMRDLSTKARAAIKTYHLRLSPHVAAARKGLTAYISGDSDTVVEILKRFMMSSLASLPDRSDKTAHVTGHAHIDMNWLWTGDETIKSFHDTFRQVIAFMDEYPDFTYIQSQAACYKAIEEMDPALFERIRHYVREGRWELGGGMWVEADTNLSGGESLTRSFLLAQRYFLDRFGKTAHVGWLPDNFGHISQLPQLLLLSECESFYCKRCQPMNGPFWWVSPNGSKILTYANKSYNKAITYDLVREFDDIVPDGHRLFIPCGVGDHGGGPTRRDIDTVHVLNSTPRHPKVQFSTAEEFFRSAEQEMDGRPTHRGEMQFIFEGCYTSVARVKEGNRHCESALFTGEFLSSLNRFLGDTYPAEDLREAWETLLFNQFHDILPGSAIHESNMDAVADYKWILSRAEKARDFALRKLADEVRIPPGQGQPVVVFNLQPRERTSLVEAEIFTHSSPATAHLSYWGDPYDSSHIEPVDIGQGMAPTVVVRDPSGKTIPAQVVWGKNFPPGWRTRILFVADDLPAGGYRSYTIDTSRPGTYNELLSGDNGEFETDFFSVGFDMSSGDIVSLRDKRTGIEYANGGLNHLRIYMEDAGSMSAWVIGKPNRIENITDVESVTVTERGPVRACVETVKKWGNSRFIQRTYIYRSYPRIDFELDVHWFERGGGTTDGPLLRVVFPLELDDPRFFCHVPFDVVERPTTGQEVPAQKWVDITDGNNGIALLNLSKYGHSFENGDLRLSLLRSFDDPDMYPDQGIQHIKYALFPHTGDWKNGVWDEGDNYHVPPLSTEPPSSALGKENASRPEESHFISLEPGNVVLSGLKESENGGEMIARLVEVNGEKTTATITVPAVVKSSRRLNLLELPLDDAEKPVIHGSTVTVTLLPHEVITLGMEIENR